MMRCRAKLGGIEGLAPYFDRIAHAYLIGEASDAFAATLAGRVAFTKCATIDEAVPRAAADALQDPCKEVAVLLSPACASFDQYPDFEKRGDAFRGAVMLLEGVRATKGEAA